MEMASFDRELQKTLISNPHFVPFLLSVEKFCTLALFLAGLCA
ncbi:uncharacterized protein J3R85_019588 [Psidium guajava]|nr:uncharacterized protein J3R85_019588 [Psidium guajava]